MLSRQKIVDHLKDRNLVKVADGAQLHDNTVRAFVKEPEKASFETVKKLSIYIEQPWAKCDGCSE